ncbi:ABC transporter ATP-binding protein [Demequina gelatinilytica]|uniref:ABC transporter ATP-binding protein n=1 Tax=Demequina gelatinilytica TaxID=1638980 RepID=UPI00078461F7|nr:ABC transporter ATP-binding protein [Demequina gelatinilytica]
MSEPAIRIEGLRKHYGDLAAVDGLDLEIPQGEVFALLGPNGAGKSTTVEILEGFRKRTAGDVTVLGADPQHATKGWRSRLGIMLQGTSEHGALTARESLRYAASLYAHPRDVDATLDAVGLAEKAGAKPATLSGGQRRRLDVALAVIGRPELVFLDEPTTGFDPEARRQFWTLIESLREDGTTILLTTHYLDEADHLADRIGIIAAGRMVALDTPGGLRSRAADARVTWTEAGTSRTEETATPTALLREILARTEGEVEGLEVVHPSLEDVYLQLIGEAAGTAGTSQAEGAAA